MDKSQKSIGALAGLALTSAVAGAVSAQSVADATGLTMQQAIEIALLEVSGEVQEAELENEDDMKLYEIEIVDANGQEFEIEIAADTGAVIKVETEDHDDENDA